VYIYIYIYIIHIYRIHTYIYVHVYSVPIDWYESLDSRIDTEKERQRERGSVSILTSCLTQACVCVITHPLYWIMSWRVDDSSSTICVARVKSLCSDGRRSIAFSFLHVPWLILACTTTHSYAWLSDMSHSYDTTRSIGASSSFILTCTMIHSYVCRDSSLRGPCLNLIVQRRQASHWVYKRTQRDGVAIGQQSAHLQLASWVIQISVIWKQTDEVEHERHHRLRERVWNSRITHVQSSVDICRFDTTGRYIWQYYTLLRLCLGNQHSTIKNVWIQTMGCGRARVDVSCSHAFVFTSPPLCNGCPVATYVYAVNDPSESFWWACI